MKPVKRYYSIVVPTRGTNDAFERILKNIIKNSPSVPIILVVNPKHQGFDERAKTLLSAYTNVKVLTCVGGGVARARNLALRVVVTDDIIFLDDDVVSSMTALDALSRGLVEGHGLVTGRVIPAPSDAPTNKIYVDFFGLDRGPSVRSYDHGYLDVFSPMNAWELGVGAVFAINRSLVNAASCPPSFDETLSNGRFCGGAEDVDFFLQCLEAGISVSYRGDAIFCHAYPDDVALLRSKMRHYSRADGAFYSKWKHKIGRADVIGDLRSWLQRVAQHTSLKLAKKPHLPLGPLFHEPADKAVGAFWWQLFSNH